MTLIPVSLRISNGALALLIVGSLVALLLGIYAWQAFKNRGKPKIERRGTLNPACAASRKCKSAFSRKTSAPCALSSRALCGARRNQMLKVTFLAKEV